MRKKDSDLSSINMPLPRDFDKESEREIKNKKLKKSISERVARNPYYVAFMAKNALPNNSLIKANTFGKWLLPYRLYEKSMAKIIRKRRLAIELEKKYQILNTELRNRLHIDDPTDDVLAMTDIDDGYFRHLNTHPRTECSPLYKSLKCLYIKQIRIKQEIGYRRDEVLNIETNHRRQLKKHQDSVEIYHEQVKQFDTFISEDYEKSITCLKKSETLYSNLTIAKISELKHFATTQFSIQSKLIGIDYLYYQQQKYGRFLYYISPYYWRAKHRDFASSVEIEAKGFDLGTSSEEDTFNIIFENMKTECARGLIKPALYFSQPGELMKMLDSTEKQQLHHFTHVAQLKPHTEKLQKMIKALNFFIKRDAAFVAHIIIDIEKHVDFDEERASQLESKFMKILYASFYDTVAATDVIQLQMNLDWCYESVFRAKSNTTLTSTAKALEDMYMKYAFKLENFSNNETKAALKQSLLEEKNITKKAYMAARELRQFNRLERSLMRAHVNDNVVIAPLPIVKRPTTRKPNVLQVEPVVKRSSQRELTEAEIEYLRLFTGWTEKDNPAKFLQILSIKPAEN